MTESIHPSDKDILYMHEEMDLTYAQIVELCGTSVRSVGRALQRARQARATGADMTLSPEHVVDQLLALAQAAQQQLAIIDPVITHRTIDLGVTRRIAVLFAGCLQLGGRWTRHDKVSEVVRQVLSHDRVYVGTFGDEIENFKSGSFAGERSVFDQVLTPPLQRVLWRRYFDQIAHKTLWGCSSQHGTQWDERIGHNPVKQSFLDHKVAFFDGQGYIKLIVGSQEYQIAIAHEFPGNSMTNPLHPQKRALHQRYPLADIVAQADRHQYAVMEHQAFGNEVIAGNRVSPFVYLLQIGTAKDGPDPYTVRGWERGQSEWPFVLLDADAHEIRVTHRWEDVQLFLEHDLLSVGEQHKAA